jgi:hypothetical protein
LDYLASGVQQFFDCAFKRTIDAGPEQGIDDHVGVSKVLAQRLSVWVSLAELYCDIVLEEPL